MALQVKDANNVVQTLKTDVDGNGQHTSHHVVDSSVLPTGAAADVSLQSIIAALTTTGPGTTSGNPLFVATVNGLATQITLTSVLTAIEALATLTETQPVSAVSLPLPTGAATQTTLASLNTTAGTIATNTANTNNQVLSSRFPTSSQSFKYVTCSNTTTPQTLVAAPGTSIQTVITSLAIGNSSASGTWVDITDGTNTISVYSTATSNVSLSLTAIGGFLAVTNSAITATTETAVTAVRVSCGYFTVSSGAPQ